jgi:hypothetical protein
VGRRTITALLALAFLSLGAPSISEAQQPTASPREPATPQRTAQPLAPGERREVPDYDGRPDVDTTDAGDVALWIPRILLSPFYLVTEFVIRRPLGFLMTESERAHVFTWLLDLFTFGPDRQVGLFPLALYEFGFSPSVGLYFYWDRFLFDENRISIRGSTWGADWLSLAVSDRITPSDQTLVTMRFTALKRPDMMFRGIGWDAADNPRSRYRLERIDASLRFGQRPWRRTTLDYEIGYRSASFANSRWDDDPGVVDLGQIPPGFRTGYNAARFGAALVLDTRELRELMTGGVRVGVFAQQNIGFGGIERSRWVTWGTSLTLSTDTLGNGRVISVIGEVAFISPFDADDPNTVVPFTELLDAGGEGPLRGFWPGEILGESVVALTLSYVWPIWVWLDAYLRATVGNAFDEYLEDFELERLSLSFDFGVRPRVKGESSFEIMLGIGTEPFVSGAGVATVRFAIGTRSDLLCLDRYCY